MMHPQAGSTSTNSKIFDQFIFGEQLGVADSARAMSVLRHLLNKGGTFGEGKLAELVGCRLYRPEWKPLIEALGLMGYVTFTLTGHALSRNVSLTENARELLTEKNITAECIEEQPTEQLQG